MSDNSVEIYNQTTKKLFLKRTMMEELSLEQF
jgi:hypothetical protein